MKNGFWIIVEIVSLFWHQSNIMIGESGVLLQWIFASMFILAHLVLDRFLKINSMNSTEKNPPELLR